MKILVRNLNRSTTEDQLHELFQPFGTVSTCILVMDERTGQSKGFGFVEMPVKEEGKRAIGRLDGKLVHGVKIRVKTTNKMR